MAEIHNFDESDEEEDDMDVQGTTTNSDSDNSEEGNDDEEKGEEEEEVVGEEVSTSTRLNQIGMRSSTRQTAQPSASELYLAQIQEKNAIMNPSASDIHLIDKSARSAVEQKGNRTWRVPNPRRRGSWRTMP